MAWWGKVVGGTLGLFIGGPLGALLGASLGHQFDKNFGNVTGRSGYFEDERLFHGNQERVQAAFFTATFSVMGYIAKADGRVSREEISMAEQVMAHMRLNEAQRQTAINLFNQGKDPEFDIDAVLEQFKYECHRRSTLMKIFMEIQVQAACADGEVDDRESGALRLIGLSLGFHPDELQQIINFILGSASSTGSKQKKSD